MGPALFSCKCRLPNKSAAVRTRPQPGTDVLIECAEGCKLLKLYKHRRDVVAAPVVQAIKADGS
jgi:hypothetical protein